MLTYGWWDKSVHLIDMQKVRYPFLNCLSYNQVSVTIYLINNKPLIKYNHQNWALLEWPCYFLKQIVLPMTGEDGRKRTMRKKPWQLVRVDMSLTNINNEWLCCLDSSELPGRGKNLLIIVIKFSTLLMCSHSKLVILLVGIVWGELWEFMVLPN